MDNNKIRLYKFTSGLQRKANLEDNYRTNVLENTGDNLYLSEDKSFIIHENSRFPLNYIKTVYFGDPRAESTKAYMRLAQRDVSVRVIYRVKERDLSMIYYHNGQQYVFSHIAFSNREYR